MQGSRVVGRQKKGEINPGEEERERERGKGN